MTENRSFDFIDAQAILFGTVFTGMSLFGLFHAIGNFALSNTFGNYAFLTLCVIMLIVSFGLFIFVPKSNALNVVLIAGLAAFFIGVTMKNKDIKDWYVDLNYNKVSESMMNGYEGASESTVYQDFVVARRNRDVEQLKEYQKNPLQYASVTADQMMNLQLFRNSINNNALSSKLDDMFKDKIVTKAEYADFQKFIANTNLNSKEIALLSFANNK